MHAIENKKNKKLTHTNKYMCSWIVVRLIVVVLCETVTNTYKVLLYDRMYLRLNEFSDLLLNMKK